MVYFLHSDEQIKEKNNILANCGKQFVPGTVTVQGKRTTFTQISNSPIIDRFIDTKNMSRREKANYLKEYTKNYPEKVWKRI